MTYANLKQAKFYNNRNLLELRKFSDPHNVSVVTKSLSGQEMISDLINRLIGNNTEVERLSEIGATFFWYQQNNGNESTYSNKIEVLAAQLIDPQYIDQLQMALHQFMNPYGNETNDSSTTNITDQDSIGEMIAQLRAQAEENKLLNFAENFQNPYQSKAGSSFDAASPSTTGKISDVISTSDAASSTSA